jgi:hypothetical protein
MTSFIRGPRENQKKIDELKKKELANFKVSVGVDFFITFCCD